VVWGSGEAAAAAAGEEEKGVGETAVCLELKGWCLAEWGWGEVAML
jgi:hypothetical protein